MFFLDCIALFFPTTFRKGYYGSESIHMEEESGFKKETMLKSK